MKIKSTIVESIAILEIEGSLSSDMKVDFDAEISRYLAESIHVILDLSKVAFIDSSTLGAIIKYYTIFKKNGRHLLLSGINQKIYDVFRLTGISKQINIFESSRNAVDFIRENG
jgi:anti-sigma B factor antagonist